MRPTAGLPGRTERGHRLLAVAQAVAVAVLLVLGFTLAPSTVGAAAGGQPHPAAASNRPAPRASTGKPTASSPVTATPSPPPTASPKPKHTPKPQATATPSPPPTASPKPKHTPKPQATATPTPSPTASSPLPSPTPTGHGNSGNGNGNGGNAGNGSSGSGGNGSGAGGSGGSGPGRAGGSGSTPLTLGSGSGSGRIGSGSSAAAAGAASDPPGLSVPAVTGVSFGPERDPSGDPSDAAGSLNAGTFLDFRLTKSIEVLTPMALLALPSLLILLSVAAQVAGGMIWIPLTRRVLTAAGRVPAPGERRRRAAAPVARPDRSPRGRQAR